MVGIYYSELMYGVTQLMNIPEMLAGTAPFTSYL